MFTVLYTITVCLLVCFFIYFAQVPPTEKSELDSDPIIPGLDDGQALRVFAILFLKYKKRTTLIMKRMEILKHANYISG